MFLLLFPTAEEGRCRRIWRAWFRRRRLEDGSGGARRRSDVSPTQPYGVDPGVGGMNQASMAQIQAAAGRISTGKVSAHNEDGVRRAGSSWTTPDLVERRRIWLGGAAAQEMVHETSS
ncbi:hypothetical protein GUJ93_ZPchr0003g17714 [Zizania palustris]|uniref:Uncharacterized protein n=1 Tax=Zizania palustris TaxID=103762 RepID=A0A8J5VX60_ZIZPA|nr:hypothetical protein GUJ93_ZPchr0003g17714 [Zizania palustris]